MAAVAAPLLVCSLAQLLLTYCQHLALIRAAMPAKKTKQTGPVRIGAEETGWVHEVPKDGQGAVGQIVKTFGCSWDEATKKLGAAMGDLNKVLAA